MNGAAIDRRRFLQYLAIGMAAALPGVSSSQYLLYCDPEERFSVVSFVWGPGQSTPTHDPSVWGLIGVLRGAGTESRT